YRLILYVQDKSIATPASETAAAIGDLQDAWLDLVLKYRNAFADEAKEYERAIKTKNYLYFDEGRPSDQIKSEIANDVTALLVAVEDNLKKYGNAIYAHFHSVDDSKALTAGQGKS